MANKFKGGLSTGAESWEYRSWLPWRLLKPTKVINHVKAESSKYLNNKLDARLELTRVKGEVCAQNQIFISMIITISCQSPFKRTIIRGERTPQLLRLIAIQAFIINLIIHLSQRGSQSWAREHRNYWNKWWYKINHGSHWGFGASDDRVE